MTARKQKRSTARQRSPRSDEEHRSQVALFNWATLAACEEPRLKLLLAVPNGGHRAMNTAKKLKAEGVKAGFPDVFLPVASSGFHGLAIEMKTATGTATTMQKWWLAELKAQGYQTAICRSSHEAIAVIREYLDF